MFGFFVKWLTIVPKNEVYDIRLGFVAKCLLAECRDVYCKYRFGLQVFHEGTLLLSAVSNDKKLRAYTHSNTSAAAPDLCRDTKIPLL